MYTPYKGFQPQSAQNLEPVCAEGLLYPSIPEKNKNWVCVKTDTCNVEKFGISCWGYEDQFDEWSEYLHTIGVQDGDKNYNKYGNGYKPGYGKRAAGDEPTDVGRSNYANQPQKSNKYQQPAYNQAYQNGGYQQSIYNPTLISLTSRCDNCNGLWSNQVHCVFNTRCLNMPPKIQNGVINCNRIIDGDYANQKKQRNEHVCMVQCNKNYGIVEDSCDIAPMVSMKESKNKGRYRREDEEGRGTYAPKPTYTKPSHYNSAPHYSNINAQASYAKPTYQKPASSYASHTVTSSKGAGEIIDENSTPPSKVVEQYSSSSSSVVNHGSYEPTEQVKKIDHIQVVGIKHQEQAEIPDGPYPPGTMTCDARTGDWDQWCRCEWKLKCQKPKKPNAKYDCWEENGVYVCQLTCKGNGQFVPAKWRDTWKFTCKRGIWIQKEPQGCVYEPPCKVPDIPNALITDCKTERCMAPLAAYQEKMPGQRNYKKEIVHTIDASSSVTSTYNIPSKPGYVPATPAHLGYSGRKRRSEENESDGYVEVNKDGDYMEFTYSEDGTPVFDPLGSTEGVPIDDDQTQPDFAEDVTFYSQPETIKAFGRGLTEETDDRGKIGYNANVGKKAKFSYSGFGTCMSRRQINGGYIHCHSVGAYHPVLGTEKLYQSQSSYGYHKPTGYQTTGYNTVYGGNKYNRGEIEAVDTCRTRTNVKQGWIECKQTLENGWVCRIRCNKGTTPASKNQFTRCENGKFNNELECAVGDCDPGMYGAACWAGLRKRREESENDETTFETDEDADEQRSLSRTYSSAGYTSNLPVKQHVSAWCELICNPGYVPVGKTSFSCDVKTGVYKPSLQGCRRTIPPPVTITTESKVVVNGNVWATCVCCNVKCQNWYKGGGFAKCVKGFWFHKDKCSKFTGCNKPNNPANGEYSCIYEHEFYGEAGYQKGNEYGDPTLQQGYGSNSYQKPAYDRKRRDSNETTEEYEFRGDVFEGNVDTYINVLKSLESDRGEVGEKKKNGYNWNDVYNKKMMCSLSCAQGYTAVQPIAICVDGKWLIPPSFCKEDYKCSPPAQDIYGQWSCRIEIVGNYAPTGYGKRKRRHDDGSRHVHNEDGSVSDIENNDRSDVTDDYQFSDYIVADGNFNIDGFAAMSDS